MGAPVSAMLLDVNWLGLAGWKWMFILEGVPGHPVPALPLGPLLVANGIL